MTFTADTSPPYAEVLELFAGGRLVRRTVAQLAMHQLVRSELVGFRDAGGRLVTVCGFLPDKAENAVELWLVTLPGLARHLPALVKLARLTVARLLEHGTAVRATVRCGHRPGARLAALLGMSKVGEVDGYELWEIRPWATLRRG